MVPEASSSNLSNVAWARRYRSVPAPGPPCTLKRAERGPQRPVSLGSYPSSLSSWLGALGKQLYLSEAVSVCKMGVIVTAIIYILYIIGL